MRTFSLLILLVCTLLPSIASAENHSQTIDGLIDQSLVQAGVQPNERLNDYAFARRAYLSVIGRIPTETELARFIAQPDRAKLIDQLFEQPGRVSHDYNFWADLLRVTDKVAGVAGGFDDYERWLKRAIAENMAYDDFVTELVTARGFVGENGAAGFYLRDRGMPLDHFANTAQVFLGTRMVCAQCHDHPFEQWAQLDFYKLAALSAQMEVVSLPADIAEKIRQATSPKSSAKNRGRSVGAYVKFFRNSAVEETDNLLRLPHDYQYDDARPKSLVEPGTPFGDAISVRDDESRSAELARWMTAESNPRFARVIANRLWKRVMGVGVVEPVDDLDSGVEVADERLLDALERMMRELDYDLIAFQKVLYRTKLFERIATAYEVNDEEHFYFPGPRHRRLSAEQIWDSIGVLVREDFDETLTEKRENLGTQYRENAFNVLRNLKDGDAILARTDEVAQVAANAVEKTYDYRQELEQLVEANDKQGARDWLNRLIAEDNRDLARFSELTGNGDDPGPAKMSQTGFHGQRQALVKLATGSFPALKEQYVEHFFRQIPPRIAELKRAAEAEAAFDKQYQRIKTTDGRLAADQYRRVWRLKQQTKWIKRASELGNPSPASHLLRELGQSDRELIDNNRRDSSIPQLLELRNGGIVERLNNPETELWVNLRGLKDSRAVIESLYLQMLTRPPRPQEIALLLPEFQASETEGIRTTIWVLLNTSEFLFPP